MCLYTGGSLLISAIDNFYVSGVIRRDDEKFEELCRLINSRIEGMIIYSFLEVTEKPYKERIMGKVSSLQKVGYTFRLSID